MALQKRPYNGLFKKRKIYSNFEHQKGGDEGIPNNIKVNIQCNKGFCNLI